jgi:putative spermidine/putrescine transport system permease protein
MTSPARAWLPRNPHRVLLALAAGLTFFIVVAPLLAVTWVSFFANKIITFPPTGYTLAWFANAWWFDRFHAGFWVSLEVSLIATAASLVIGVPAAVALARAEFPGREAVHSLLMSPLIVPGIVAGAAVYMFFIEIEVATDIQIAGTLAGLCLAHTLIALPWTVRLVAASLIGMDRQIEEAAMSLGAPPLTTFRRITLPVIRPGIVAAAMFSFIVSFVDLEKSLFLVAPGRTTLPIEIVNYLEWNIDPTIAAVATMQTVVIALALFVSDRFFKLSRAF